MQPIKADVSFPNIEVETLKFWESQDIFKKSNEQRKNAKEFAFYDGPPFANGLPHYGHLLANTVKDTVPRYWVMRGFFIERRCGWDCHGVPVEYEIEKREKIRGRKEILTLGIQKFNDMCRQSAVHYAGEWKKTLTRLGRWVDWEDQYRTMDKNFMESVWWVFKQLHEKGLVYRDYKVVSYSPRITTVLSNFEANQNYKSVQDPAVTVKFKLKDENAYALAMTTTPWTLISNLALCAGPDITYAKVRDLEKNETYYVAEKRLGAYYKPDDAGKKYEILETLPGTALRGKKYEPLFPYFKEHANAFQILVDAYASAEEGTGIVHNAPAFGEDDYRVCHLAHIDLVDPLDEEGVFKPGIGDISGQFFKDADKSVIKQLKERGAILKHDTIVHNYPFCDRTDSPLIFRAIPAWYVAVEKIRDRLVINNQKVNWVPEHLRDGRMGKWLESARDWAVSRNRYWGTPLPIWLCDANEKHMVVLGSSQELAERSGVKLDDLHKPGIDDVTFKCADCKGTMRRVPEVFDCWFESGSMPYAQLHYPFENKERFTEIYPADFIAEGLDQTRGWFYTLTVLAGALFDKPAFRNVIVNGTILDETGRKMSKRHRNYTAPELLLEKYGADSVRLYMLNSAILRGEDLIFSDTGVKDTTRALLLPLWNSLSFLTTYASADGWHPTADMGTGQVPHSENELDQWVVSRLHTLMQNVHAQMEEYKLYAVVPYFLAFVDDLTNWYIRRSRRRFWGAAADDEENGEATQQLAKRAGGVGADTQSAYETLYYTLLTFAKVFAPFAPMTSEKIYRTLTEGLRGVPESVHLCDMPMPDVKQIRQGLEEKMALLQRISVLGRSLRAKHKLKTRQALAEVLVISNNADDKAIIDVGAEIIREELNIKRVVFSADESQFVNLTLKPNLRTLGKRLGKDLNTVKQALEKMNSDKTATARVMQAVERGEAVDVAGFALTKDDFLIERGPKDDRLIATDAGVTVLLDTRLTPELIQEGLARELVNRIQKLRKESGLAVSDRIRVCVAGTAELEEAWRAHHAYIAAETLAETAVVGSTELKNEAGQGFHVQTADIDGKTVYLGLSKV